MSSERRGWVFVAGLVAAAVCLRGDSAHAWPGHDGSHHCSPAPADCCLPQCPPACHPIPVCAAPGWCFGGISFGVVGHRSFFYSSPGFWCGTWYPCVVPLYPYGLYSFYPVSFHPGPVFGPWGPIVQRPAARVMPMAARPLEAVRVVNQATRQRAARLVAVGDRHLRSAVADRARLRSALDAYRRAEAIAADEPDTLLRQALVLTALDRPDDAEDALRRAVAVDGRLGEAPVAVAGGAAPDPVFGDRPLGSPSSLAARSAGLVAGIFGEDGDANAGANWIADRWARRVQADVQVAARR